MVIGLNSLKKRKHLEIHHIMGVSRSTSYHGDLTLGDACCSLFASRTLWKDFYPPDL